MGLVCIDTQAIIWGVCRTAKPGQEEMIERAALFFAQCEEQGDTLVVPTVVLAELLAGLPTDTHAVFVQELQERFVVAAFDGPAALTFGRLWHTNKDGVVPQVRQENDQVTRSVVKMDHMIAATAIGQRCDALCTDDHPLQRFSEKHIPLRSIADLTIPAKQMKLSDGVHDGPFEEGTAP